MLAGEKNQELPLTEEKKLVGHEDIQLIESKKKRIDELEDRLIHLQADFENYKKRTLKENDMLRQNSTAEIILRILPIIDEFEIALMHTHSHAGHDDFKKGMELIYVKFLDLLACEGIQEMKVKGEQFDPYKHDAIRQEEGEDEKIIEVIQKGYLFKGKILRHAKVIVGKKDFENKIS